MNRRLASLLIAPAALVAYAQPVMAQHVLNVRDADIRAFIADAARVTGRTFVVDGRVQGKVTVVTERPLNRAEYFEIFLSTLRANGLIAIPLPNGSYRIQPTDNAASQPSRLGTQGASANQYVTEVIRLRYVDATQAIETLRPLVSPQGSVTANRNANSLVVVDFADNVRRVRALIQSIDRDASATRLVHLRNSGAREMAASLQQLGAGQAGANGAPATGGVTVSAFDSSNSIAIRGDAAQVERFVALANELDERAASATEIRVYTLQHADAARMLPTLQQLVGGGSDPTPGSETPSSNSSSGEGGNTPTPSAAPASRASTSGAGGSIATRGPGTLAA